MTPVSIHLTVNGREHTLASEPCRTLLSLLREDLGLTSVKEGCGQGDCGACVVILDGQAVNACLVFAAQAEGASILTVEGLAQDGALHPLQARFIERWAFQCGYCTPGMLMTAKEHLDRHPDGGTDEEIREAIAGVLCRCTGYQQIIESIRAAATTGKGA